MDLLPADAEHAGKVGCAVALPTQLEKRLGSDGGQPAHRAAVIVHGRRRHLDASQWIRYGEEILGTHPRPNCNGWGLHCHPYPLQ